MKSIVNEALNILLLLSYAIEVNGKFTALEN